MTTLRIPAEQPWHPGHVTQPRRKPLRRGWIWLQRALLGGALVLLLALAVFPRFGLYRPVTVLSGSMRPTFSPGDMVLVAPEPISSVRVGQVISYRVPVGAHQVETHRVIRILHGGTHPVIQTQGDANNWPDPWTARLEGKTAWRLVGVIPHLGYAVNWLRGPAVRMAAVIVAPALLVLLMLLDIWGGDKEERRSEAEDRATTPNRGALGVEGHAY
jgi:signal peptidase